ncbi:short chain dehydrogenase reductase [Pseudovirgaria hyperparasitica]|uniref:Short chain dehydrogenase reductase n=1 Tax=Pseudovirgaria hyperparasitica TaxID=470096 RepID=A0A6A6VUY3_9PEZI|nr:short chain dehydrogenase reductase [Pseudovirgaria hyperparasitica]KAF2753077.1 short chain dehydrogenase reductase [Pseudovirgaria hyperparasitica]
MTSINIRESLIPELGNRVALITGGASGIGYAAACIMAAKGATVHVLDLSLPDSEEHKSHLNIIFHVVDISDWAQLRDKFAEIGRIDYAFANAGVTEETNYFADTFDDKGNLLEPSNRILDVNFKGPINLIKLAWSSMKAHGVAGSIVLTTSATAYAPEQSLPVYAGAKHGLIGLIRALRSIIAGDNITINGVAPAATITKLLPQDLAAPIIAMGLPVSSAHFVGLALVFSATAKQARRVEPYGKETEKDALAEERWNGRVILTLGDQYTEMEGPLAELRPFWFGRSNLELTRLQQAATDFR